MEGTGSPVTSADAALFPPCKYMNISRLSRAKDIAARGASHVPSAAAPRAKMATMAENFIVFEGIEICGI